MTPDEYKDWWQLHLRVCRGNELSDAERADYDRGLQSLDRAESSEVELSSLRTAREEVKRLESENAALRQRRQSLEREISALEAALDEQTKSALSATE